MAGPSHADLKSTCYINNLKSDWLPIITQSGMPWVFCKALRCGRQIRNISSTDIYFHDRNTTFRETVYSSVVAKTVPSPALLINKKLSNDFIEWSLQVIMRREWPDSMHVCFLKLEAPHRTASTLTCSRRPCSG